MPANCTDFEECILALGRLQIGKEYLSLMHTKVHEMMRLFTDKTIAMTTPFDESFRG
jgi:hypothetical protein